MSEAIKLLLFTAPHLALIFLAASVTVLAEPNPLLTASQRRWLQFFCLMYLIAIGMGLFRGTLQGMGALR